MFICVLSDEVNILGFIKRHKNDMNKKPCYIDQCGARFSFECIVLANVNFEWYIHDVNVFNTRMLDDEVTAN